MKEQPTTNIRVSHRFNAAPERVFDAWLQPDKIAAWMLGPAGGEMVSVRSDARVGGTFSFVVRRDGEEIDHTGEYLELVRPLRLVFSWGTPRYSPDKSVVSIDIVPAADGCELTLTADRVLAEWASRTQTGWSRIVEAVSRALSKG
jgi:uncharacterized protein YndB with AHSA1/START domain